MQRLAREISRHRIDAWLKDIVAGVLQSSDTLTIDRLELWELLDNLPAAILISTDRACARIVGNKTAQALLRVPHGNNLSQSAPDDERPAFRIYRDDKEVDPDDLPMQVAARTGKRVGRSECEIRFEVGESVFLAGHCIPIQDENGEVCGSLGAFVDVTEQRMELDELDVLAKEMVHRVKNTVSLIQSLANSTIRKFVDPDEFSAFENRLIGISRAQDLLGDQRTGANIGELISLAVRPVVQTLFSRVSIEGPALGVPADVALSMSMIFHELATNACKYGSLSNASGRVCISWDLDVGESGIGVSLEWLELSGPVIESPGRPGFGSKLIARLCKSLPNGTARADYRPDGLRFSMEFSILATPAV